MAANMFQISLIADLRSLSELHSVHLWLTKWQRDILVAETLTHRPFVRIWHIATPLKPLLDAPESCFFLSDWAMADGGSAYRLQQDVKSWGKELYRCPALRAALAEGMRWR